MAMKYAVIRLGGKQYKVSVGEELVVDKILDLKHIEPEPLLVVDGDKVQIGKPILSDVKVKVKVLAGEEKGKKIEIFKFKAKSRYRRHTGFRPKYTRLLIESIN